MSFEKFVSRNTLIINELQVRLRTIKRFCRFSRRNILSHVGTPDGIRKVPQFGDELLMGFKKRSKIKEKQDGVRAKPLIY